MPETLPEKITAGIAEAEQSSPRDEASMLRLLVAGEEDAEGMIAFALHRQAMLDWQQAFATVEKRPPDAAETRHFLIGEAAPRRVKDYRERAALMIGLARETGPAGENDSLAAAPVKNRRMIWPFGPGMGFAIEAAGGPVPWRQLMLRLLMLMAAVIVTALLLRVFVVQK